MCVRPRARADERDGRWRPRGQNAPFEAAFSNLSGSESVQNPVSTWQALHISLIKSEKSLISICLIDNLLDELHSSLSRRAVSPPLYKNTPRDYKIASGSHQLWG